MQPVTFTYRNHKGITAERTVIPDSIEWMPAPGYGYQPGWFISGICQDKKQRRSFALSHIVLIDASTFCTLKLLESSE